MFLSVSSYLSLHDFEYIIITYVTNYSTYLNRLFPQGWCWTCPRQCNMYAYCIYILIRNIQLRHSLQWHTYLLDLGWDIDETFPIHKTDLCRLSLYSFRYPGSQSSVEFVVRYENESKQNWATASDIKSQVSQYHFHRLYGPYTHC